MMISNLIVFFSSEIDDDLEPDCNLIDDDLEPDCQENLSKRRRRSSSSVMLRDWESSSLKRIIFNQLNY